MPELTLDIVQKEVPISPFKIGDKEYKWKIVELLGDEAEQISTKFANRAEYTFDKDGRPVFSKIKNYTGIQFDLLELAIKTQDNQKVPRADFQKLPAKTIAVLYKEAQKLNQLGEFSPKDGEEIEAKNE